MGEKADADNWKPALGRVLTSAWEKKTLVVNACHSVSRELVERYLCRNIEYVMRPLVVREAKQLGAGRRACALCSIFPSIRSAAAS